MLKKRIAAAVAAIMTISSLGIIASAEVIDGQTYDKLLGNELIEGTFENGVNVGADRWVPTASVRHIIDNTYGNSAGAIFADQTASTVYSGFSMKSNRIYHAEAQIKLYNNVSDNATLVLATKNGSEFVPIASTAVETEVNGTEWTKLEGDFIRTSASTDSAYVYCYIELENETKFYLDNVIIKDTNRIFPAGTEFVSLDGEDMQVGKLVAGADGKIEVFVAAPIEKGVEYKLSAYVFLGENVQAQEPQARVYSRTGRVIKSGDPVALTDGWQEVEYTDTLIADSSSSASRDIYLEITAAEEDDVVYYRGISVQPVTVPADEAEITSVSLDAFENADTVATVDADGNTVALKYFYSVDGKIIKTGHTNSGDFVVPPVYLDASYAGKEIELAVWPMNADCVYGDKVVASATVEAPFESGTITKVVDDVEGAVTESFDITNASGSPKTVAALVAYYNSKGEMIGIGVQSQYVADDDTVNFTVTVPVVPETGDYSKLYILDGATTDGALSLLPLADAK